jgi:uncharacterized protein (DUF952 family)
LTMPVLVTKPTTVVEIPGVKINEFFGGASCNPCNGDISVAHVIAQPGFAEEWQTPAFDEYTLVLKGEVNIQHTHGATVKVCAGQAVFMPKGERVRWVMGSEGAEYVPIALPAFSPANCFREEHGVAPPLHDSHTDIYHLVQVPLWKACTESGETYYPPTYQQDGFIHATADPSMLLGVANHFYKSVVSDWLCLRMTRATLAAAGITLKFEDPAPVGTTPALSSEQSGGERFPHIFGGIPPSTVVGASVVYRGPDGEYLGIEGLCGMDKQGVEALWRSHKSKQSKL